MTCSNPALALSRLGIEQAGTTGHPQGLLVAAHCAELDGCVTKYRLAHAGLGAPLHVTLESDGQRASGLECGVVRSPVRGLVAGLGSLRHRHVARLLAWGCGLMHTWTPPACQALVHDDEKVKIAPVHPDFPAGLPLSQMGFAGRSL